MNENQDIVVDPVIPTLRFRCDVKRCKGACCTIPGGRGAPLLDEEIAEIHRVYPIVRKYLSKEHRDVIEKDGMFEGRSGDFVTTCVGRKACVFVTFEDGIARCAIEKAYLNGEVAWRKPLSCHLFPIRIDRGVQGQRLRYEYLDDCAPGLENGSQTNVALPVFARDALVRAYGQEWYDRFLASCRIPGNPDHSGA